MREGGGPRGDMDGWPRELARVAVRTGRHVAVKRGIAVRERCCGQAATDRLRLPTDEKETGLSLELTSPAPPSHILITGPAPHKPRKEEA